MKNTPMQVIRLSNDETEKLINKIQKFPAIYNPNLDEHRDRGLLENLFNRIAMEINIEGLSGMLFRF